LSDLKIGKSDQKGVGSEDILGRRHHDIALIAGPLLALLLFFLPPPAGLELPAWRVAAIAVWMAIWWAGEAVPVAVTALLPIVAFPLLGVMPIGEATAPYANPLIYLFFGGFLIALAVERWGLHRRVALIILTRVADHPRRLVAGFMIAAAFLSMWITNTATTIMMLPIAISIIPLMAEDPKISKGFGLTLLLGLAYAASIGGMGTLVGTAPNALFAGFMKQTYDIEIGFAQWLLVGIPTVLILLPATWFMLCRRNLGSAVHTKPEVLATIAEQKNALGPMSKQEIRVGIVFLCTASLWVLRPTLQNTFGLSFLSDGGIAMAGAIAMFVIPADWRKRDFLLNWDWARRTPFDALILFGGGLSLAAAISTTGLAVWLGEGLGVLGTAPTLLLIGGIVALVVFLTELTSNTATTAAFLPVIGAVASELGMAPIELLAPMVVAASCAFMLPVATPPNAVVFGSGLISVPQMARAGFYLNLIGICVITLLGKFLYGVILNN